MTVSRVEVESYVRLLDHILEEKASEFGADHWHSLIRNLSTLQPENWDALPVGAGRTIRDLVIHIGACSLMYGNHAFGDGTRDWNDHAINGLDCGETPAEIIAWLRAAHSAFREAVNALTDDQLGQLRPAPWGDRYEARRIIEIMIQHPLYHIGEVNHIRALVQGNDDWDHEDMGRDETS